MIKIKYQKQAKKVLAFYKEFVINPPYNIIECIVNAIKKKIDVYEQLTDLLKTDKYVMWTTESIIKIINKTMTDDKFKDVRDELDVFKVAAVTLEKCPLEIQDPKTFDSLTPAGRSILRALGEKNDNQYFVMTDRPELAKYIRDNIPNVPLMRINHNLIMLDWPSPFATQVHDKLKSEKIKLLAHGSVVSSKKRSLDEPIKEVKKAKLELELEKSKQNKARKELEKKKSTDSKQGKKKEEKK